MENMIELISVPAIASVVYIIIEVIKKSTNSSEKFLKLIPLVSLLLGVTCGIVCYYAMPEYITASNIIMAILIGGASGLSATGTNQIFKQINKSEVNKNDRK